MRIKIVLALMLLSFLLLGCDGGDRPLHPEQKARIAQSIARADSAYESGDDETAAMAYVDALKRGSTEARIAVKAARSFAQNESDDLALRYLMLAVKMGYHDTEALTKQPAFTTLKGSPQWDSILGAVKRNFEKYLNTLNREVYEMMLADQADRKEDFSSLSQEELAGIAERDSARLTRITEIVEAGELDVADDYFNAALVFQHGADSNAYKMAYRLSTKAFQLDSTFAHAAWLSAASQDRYLQSVGKPQVYGTQYWYKKVHDGSELEWTMEPYDTTAVTDAERQRLHVPSLAEQRVTLLEMQNQ